MRAHLHSHTRRESEETKKLLFFKTCFFYFHLKRGHACKKILLEVNYRKKKYIVSAKLFEKESAFVKRENLQAPTIFETKIIPL
jgi:hypothetical protein